MVIPNIDVPVPWLTTEQMVEVDRLMIDGLIGYSLRGKPRGEAADLIRWANAGDTPVLSLDVPSGIDAGSGEVLDPAIRATATLTLALPKIGLRAAGAVGHVGELFLGDIGVPPSLYAGPSLGLPAVGPLFATGDVVQLMRTGPPHSPEKSI